MVYYFANRQESRWKVRVYAGEKATFRQVALTLNYKGIHQ